MGLDVYDRRHTSGPLLTLGTSGGLATLNFNGGGSLVGDGFPATVDYYVIVFLPGNWTTPGTGPGDYMLNGYNSAVFGPRHSLYDLSTNTTTVEMVSHDFAVNDATGLDFTLYSAVPEPSSWALMLAGFAAVGFFGYRASRQRMARAT